MDELGYYFAEGIELRDCVDSVRSGFSSDDMLCLKRKQLAITFLNRVRYLICAILQKAKLAF